MFLLSAEEKKGTPVVGDLNENEKKALAAGVLLGIAGTFAAVLKAALEQAAKKPDDTKE